MFDKLEDILMNWNGEYMDGRIIEAYREVLADELCKMAKDYIHYDFNKGTYFMPRLEGSLYVGIKV